jgi:hypothetical protein
MRIRTVISISAVSIAALAAIRPLAATTPHFYADDPIVRAPEPQDAGGAAPSRLDLMYELTYNLFVLPRHKPSGVRAQNLNTIDEVPDSSWFTNRIGTKALSIDDAVRGPVSGAPPDPSRWIIWREKTSGSHPGITAKDANGATWFLEFDPPYYPNAATAAPVINSKIFWALGYNQVESFLTTFDPRRMEIHPDAKFVRPNGKRTPVRRADVEELLEHAARRPDGTYRVFAGRLIPGTIIGTFRYQGTRPDDPNDLVPHENRRELRALGVFGAWTNVTDFKAENTLDTILAENGHRVVKHYLQDVGSSLGMCNDIYTWDVSWEYFYNGPAMAKRLASFGFALSPWQTVKNTEGPEIGRFEGDRFDPRTWRTHTPNAALMEMRDDDAFWAARRIAAFSNEMVRAIVHTGEFTDPSAEKAIADILIKRRDKILRTYLPAVNPIVTPRLENDRLSFENAAVAADVAKTPERYRASWFQFDNATGEKRPLGETTSATTTMDAPRALPAGPGSFILVEISAESREYAAWKRPIRTYFRRQGAEWALVGLERTPDGPADAALRGVHGEQPERTSPRR